MPFRYQNYPTLHVNLSKQQTCRKREVCLQIRPAADVHACTPVMVSQCEIGL